MLKTHVNIAEVGKETPSTKKKKKKSRNYSDSKTQHSVSPVEY